MSELLDFLPEDFNTARSSKMVVSGCSLKPRTAFRYAAIAPNIARGDFFLLQRRLQQFENSLSP